MPGLTIREFTISTKVINTDRPEKPKNQSKSGNGSTPKNGSEHSYQKARAKSMSTKDQENIIRLCVNKVLEIIQHQEER